MFDTEPSKVQVNVGKKELQTEENSMLDQSGVQQSAKTLLRKIQTEIKGVPAVGKLDEVRQNQSQVELYSKLSSLLEQCLIVDNFNKEVDESLDSYIKKESGKKQDGNEQDDFFYQSVLEH